MASPYLYAYNRSTRALEVPPRKNKMKRHSIEVKRREEINGRLLENWRFFSVHALVHSIDGFSSKNYTQNRIDLCRWSKKAGARERVNTTFTRTGMNMLAKSRQELSSINSIATEERAATTTTKNRIAVMMMMRTSTTTKKVKGNRKVAFFALNAILTSSRMSFVAETFPMWCMAVPYCRLAGLASLGNC